MRFIVMTLKQWLFSFKNFFIYSVRSQQLPFKICLMFHYLPVWVIRRSQRSLQMESRISERVKENRAYRLFLFIKCHHWIIIHQHVSFVKHTINITKQENNYCLPFSDTGSLFDLLLRNIPNPGSVICTFSQIYSEG